MEPLALLAQSMGGAWTSGVNAYATCAALGLLGRYGGIELGGSLIVLESWWVIVPAVVMYVAEFFADKVPWLDSTWDAAHTFVRVPAGALLAASVYSESGAAVQVAALLAGGALAGEAHALKAGTRALINASPEPLTNWTASIAEDSAVIGGILFAVNHPVYFVGLLAVIVVVGATALHRMWRSVRPLFRRTADLVRRKRHDRVLPHTGAQPAA